MISAGEELNLSADSLFMDMRSLNRRVLVVDDEPANVKLICEILERIGCEVRGVASGEAALKELADWPAALVMLDQDMPGLSGLETLMQIKKDFPGVDVMFVSAHSNPRMVSSALEQGADDYLKKPFSVVELSSRVRVRFRIRDLREDLRVANQKLAELSVTDDLTGLFNMRSMYEKIEYELKRCRRSGKTIGVIMFDMDHFKSVNDGHDHLFGSYVIKEMGRLLKDVLRDTDFAARYGGDEFLVVLPDTDEAGVRAFSERLLRTVREYTFTDDGNSIKLTLSLGFATGGSKFVFGSKELVRVADHALYEAKENGRNQVRGFGPEQTVNYYLSVQKKVG